MKSYQKIADVVLVLGFLFSLALLILVVLTFSSLPGTYNNATYCQLQDTSACEVLAIPRTDPISSCSPMVEIGNTFYYLKKGTCEVIKPKG